MAKPMLQETAYTFIEAMWSVVEPEVDSRAQELFGDSEYCTDAEFDIIFSGSLSHAEKVAALKVLRRRTLVIQN
jgi:hypothetical protein